MEDEVLDVMFERRSGQRERACRRRLVGCAQGDAQVTGEPVGSAEVDPMLLVVDAVVSVETRTECRQLPHDRPGRCDELWVNVIDVPGHLPSIPTVERPMVDAALVEGRGQISMGERLRDRVVQARHPAVATFADQPWAAINSIT